MTAQTLDAQLARHRAQARATRLLDEELGTYHGIDWAAFVLLDLLQAEGGAMPAARAAAELGLSPTRLLLQVLPLEKLGLVCRTQGNPGGRQLALAASGERVLAQARETAGEVAGKGNEWWVL